MRKSSWIVLLALLFAAIGAPGISKADTVVFDSSTGTITVVTDTTTGITYDITTAYCAGPCTTDYFATQIWADDLSLADEFATAVGDSLGDDLQSFGSPAGLGPFLAFTEDTSTGQVSACVYQTAASSVSCDVNFGYHQSAVYAVDTPVTAPTITPESGTLSLLFSGLLGLGLLAGVKLYRENRLATIV